jgi:hypothetical protein
MAQLHSAAAEPDSTDASIKVELQMRRRIFWSAYALNRTFRTVFNLPFSVPDAQISVKMYANINDDELEARGAEAFPDDPPGIARLTDVSAAMHVVYSRRIQSEVLNITLHNDKLDRWKSLASGTQMFTPRTSPAANGCT